MSFNKLNTLFGWVSFVFALTVYGLTVEPTGSLWDCGEFISAAYRLQVVHPPGAPLFLLIGRFFSLFASDPTMVAFTVNMLSATLSAFCVMFTFWITTYFARKAMSGTDSENPTGANMVAILVAGLVASFTLTFTDTFWFSAVEAEVYAASSFFMSFTFWCILKWERVADRPGANRWLVFIGYLVGLAIGVHLLNLLVIPGIVLVYYFKKYNYSRNGLLAAIAVGFVLLFTVQLFIIPGIPTLAAKLDLLFVNSFGLGFGSGVIFFAILLLSGLLFGLYYTHKNQKVVANTALLAFSFILIGYSSYAMVVIRSQANPPIDMNSPEDPLTLVYYLNREQYGERPLLKGPHFETKALSFENTDAKYIRGKEKYEITHYDFEIKWDPNQMMLFPRIYDQNDPGHAQGYKEWAEIPDKKTPNMSHNLRFFRKYQLGHMYFRYFMWNFSGRQNDDQGMRPTDLLEGNWISGIGPVDAVRLGPQKNLPEDMKTNPSRNTYYLLPFIFGVLGIILQFKKDKHGMLINGLLFVVTGVMLIVYLNPPPYEPRERDYVFVGSFQVFCTWVGIGILALYTWIKRYLNPTSAVAIAAAIGLLGSPALMGSQNWDDHDRSGRYMSSEFAKNYLKSCLPNAILFTNGDNDTYPLWYVQNVEGYRTDVRVVNLSLLNAADYAESLRIAHYDSKPFRMTFAPEQMRTGTRDRIFVNEQNQVAASGQYVELIDMLKFAANDQNPQAKVMVNGKQESFFPTRKVKITVNKDEVIRRGIVKESMRDSIVNEIRFELPGNTVNRNSYVLLDILANNLWERPVYFTTTTGSETYIGLQNYFQLDGLTYHVVPILTVPSDERAVQAREFGFIDSDKMYAQLVDSFEWGGLESENMWVDDKMRLVPSVMRATYLRTARQLIREQKKDKAIALLDECMKNIPDHNLPLEGHHIEIGEAYYLAGANEKARGVMDIIANRMLEKGLYLKQFRGSKFVQAKQQLDYIQRILTAIQSIATQYKDTEKANAYAAMVAQVS